MVQSSGNERGQLLTIIIVLLFPTFFWVVFSLLNSSIPADAPWRDWLHVPTYSASAILLVLPFLWKGSLSFKSVIGRVFRKSDWATVCVSLIPMILFVGAMLVLPQDPNNPYHFGQLTNIFAPSPYRTQLLLTVFLINISGIYALVLISNATKLGDRVLFFGLRFGIGIVLVVTQFVINLSHGLPGPDAMKYISPLPIVFEMLGSFLVICGLMRLGRNSVQAVALSFLDVGGAPVGRYSELIRSLDYVCGWRNSDFGGHLHGGSQSAVEINFGAGFDIDSTAHG